MSIKFEQQLELYHYGESLCSQKIRVGLIEKALPFKSHYIMLCDIHQNCQNLTPEYLRVNPKGQVPTLVHNGTPVYDAHRQIKYIDEYFPDSGISLWPSDAERARLAGEWFEEGMLTQDAPLGLTFGNAIPVVSGELLAHTLQKQPLEAVEQNMSHHPIETRAKMFVRLRRHGSNISSEKMDVLLTTLARGLRSINQQLADTDGRWLLGDFSLPDITLMACFHRLKDVHLDDALRHPVVPNLAPYWERLQERPSYKTGITDWHDQDNLRPAIAEVYGGKPSRYLDQLNQKLAFD